jgi:acyl-coenzyme A thioesterase PaaI-like protein
MVSRRHLVSLGALAGLMLATGQAASAQENKENKMQLFKVTTVKDEIVIGLSADELKALGGNDAGAVAHALAQKGDMTVWQYNVHRGVNGELVQSPTAKIGLLANASLRVEPYATTYTIVPHE